MECVFKVNRKFFIQWKVPYSCKKKKKEGNRKSFSAKPKMSRPAFHKMLKEVFQMKGNGTRWELGYKRKDEEHWWWWNVSKYKKVILFPFLLFLKDKWLLQGKSLALYHGVCNVWKWGKKMKMVQEMGKYNFIVVRCLHWEILWVPQACWCPSLSDGDKHRAGSPISGGRWRRWQGGQEAPRANVLLRTEMFLGLRVDI